MRVWACVCFCARGCWCINRAHVSTGAMASENVANCNAPGLRASATDPDAVVGFYWCDHRTTNKLTNDELYLLKIMWQNRRPINVALGNKCKYNRTILADFTHSNGNWRNGSRTWFRTHLKPILDNQSPQQNHVHLIVRHRRRLAENIHRIYDFPMHPISSLSSCHSYTHLFSFIDALVRYI